MKRRLVDIVHLLLAATALAACEHIVDPALPSDAVAFAPPPVYTRWWAETEACSGQTGSLTGITWDVVPNTSDFQLNGETVSGYWTEASNSIVLAAAVRLDGQVVRHEMLHALTRSPGHPRVDFLEHCGGIVSCTSQCLTGGPYPTVDNSLPVVSPDSLVVNISLVPDAPSPAIDSGAFTVVVSVHNPFNRSIIAALPQVTGGGSTVYSLEIKIPSGPGKVATVTRSILDPSVFVFTAGETKYQYFDFFISNAIGGGVLSPGVYDFIGSYGSHSTTLPQVSIQSN
ncbi:MAG: hypothetical protein ACRD3J_08710 [Thermoanaerobaculia bacterium]